MEFLNISRQKQFDGRKSQKYRALLGATIVAAVVGLSSTLAAQININSGPVEFGQGVAQTVSCSGDASVMVTPTSSFVNTNKVVIPFSFLDSGFDIHELDINADSLTVGMAVTGINIPIETVITEIVPKYDGDSYNIVRVSTSLDVSAPPSGNLTFVTNESFNLSSVTVSEIPEACTNKVFTIKIYDNTNSTPLTISDFAGGDTSAMVWWANGYGETGYEYTPTNKALLYFPASEYLFEDGWMNENNGGFPLQTNFDSSSVSANAFKINLPKTVDASRVYKITIETQDDSSALNIRSHGSNFYHYWW